MGSLLPVQTGLVSSPLHTFTRTFMCARVHMHTPPVRAHRYMHAHSVMRPHACGNAHTLLCIHVHMCSARTCSYHTHVHTHEHTCTHLPMHRLVDSNIQGALGTPRSSL